MLYVLYGPDGYRIRQTVEKEILSRILLRGAPPASFSFDCQDDPRADERISDALKGVSLFDTRKIIIVRNISGLSADSEKAIIGTLKHHAVAEDQDVTVVFTDIRAAEKRKTGSLPKAKALLKYVRDEKGIVRELLPPSGAELARWLKNEFAERKKEIDADAIRELIQYAGSDMGALAQEIEKLSNYSRGRITEEDVRSLTVPRLEFGVFDLTDALAQKNKKLAVELLYRMLAQDGDPYRILTAVTYQFRTFLMVKDLLDRKTSQAEIVRKIGVHPFVVQKAVSQLPRFTLPELKDIYAELARLDVGAKQGKLNLVDELYRFILR